MQVYKPQRMLVAKFPPVVTLDQYEMILLFPYIHCSQFIIKVMIVFSHFGERINVGG